MAKLPLLSSHEVIKALAKVGFEQVSRKGSHIKLKSKGDEKTRIVIVPDFNEIPTGTLLS